MTAPQGDNLVLTSRQCETSVYIERTPESGDCLCILVRQPLRRRRVLLGNQMEAPRPKKWCSISGEEHAEYWAAGHNFCGYCREQNPNPKPNGKQNRALPPPGTNIYVIDDSDSPPPEILKRGGSPASQLRQERPKPLIARPSGSAQFHPNLLTLPNGLTTHTRAYNIQSDRELKTVMSLASTSLQNAKGSRQTTRQRSDWTWIHFQAVLASLECKTLNGAKIRLPYRIITMESSRIRLPTYALLDWSAFKRLLFDHIRQHVDSNIEPEDTDNWTVRFASSISNKSYSKIMEDFATPKELLRSGYLSTGPGGHPKLFLVLESTDILDNDDRTTLPLKDTPSSPTATKEETKKRRFKQERSIDRRINKRFKSEPLFKNEPDIKMESSNRDNSITFQSTVESEGYTNDNDKEETIEVIDCFPESVSDIMSGFISPSPELVRI